MIKDYTLEDRIQWITDKKDEGSLLFKNQEWQDAIDVWMKANLRMSVVYRDGHQAAGTSPVAVEG